MTISEAICQLQDLKADRESFLDGDDDEIYEADIAAIEAAIQVMQKTACLQRTTAGAPYGKDEENEELRSI